MATQRAYEKAMRRVALNRVEMDVPVLTLSCVVGALHIALTHPEFPPGSREEVAAFIRQVIAPMKGVEPDIAEAWERHGLKMGAFTATMLRPPEDTVRALSDWAQAARKILDLNALDYPPMPYDPMP